MDTDMSELEQDVTTDIDTETQEILSPVEDGQDPVVAENSETAELEAEEAEGESGGGDEIIITLDGEVVSDDEEVDEGSEDDSAVIKAMRAKLKAVKKENRRFQREADELKAATVTPAEELGPRPTQADYDFDEDKYVGALSEWLEKSKAVEAKKATAIEKQKAVAESVQSKTIAMRETAARIPNFEESSATVDTLLSPAHREALIFAADDPASVIHALGNRPKLAKEVADLDLTQAADLINFGQKIATIQGKLKVTTRKPTPPERKVAGNTGQALSLDKQLEKAQEAARKSGGDYDTVFKLKRQIKGK